MQKIFVVLLGIILFSIMLPVLLFVQESRANTRTQVDNFLILALDSSNSIDNEEYILQMRGYREAFLNPEVRNKLLRAPSAIMVFEWASQQATIVPCVVIKNEADLDRIARRIAGHERSSIGFFTGVAGALRYAYEAITDRCSFIEADRVIIDISADGIENINSTQHVARERERLIELGVTINNLIVGPPGMTDSNIDGPMNVAVWYRENVQTGFGSFTMEVSVFELFEQMLMRKITLELSQVSSTNSNLR